jgi:hypothetical protein
MRGSCGEAHAKTGHRNSSVKYIRAPNLTSSRTPRLSLNPRVSPKLPHTDIDSDLTWYGQVYDSVQGVVFLYLSVIAISPVMPHPRERSSYAAAVPPTPGDQSCSPTVTPQNSNAAHHIQAESPSDIDGHQLTPANKRRRVALACGTCRNRKSRVRDYLSTTERGSTLSV